MSNADLLGKPFPVGETEFRTMRVIKNKGAFCAAYIQARHVFDRMDAVFGQDAWGVTIEHGDLVALDGGRYHLHTVARIAVGGQVYDGTGESVDKLSDGKLYKTSESDAVKRAAVAVGIGRYLYTLGDQWVGAAELRQGKYMTDAALNKLRKSLDGQLRKQGLVGADDSVASKEVSVSHSSPATALAPAKKSKPKKKPAKAKAQPKKKVKPKATNAELMKLNEQFDLQNKSEPLRKQIHAAIRDDASYDDLLILVESLLAGESAKTV